MSEENQYKTPEEDSSEKNQESAYRIEFGEPQPDPSPKKKERRISLSTFLVSCVALVLAAVMTTYTCCNLAYQKRLAEAQLSQTVTGSERYYPFELFDAILDTYSFADLDDEEMLAAALKAYVDATGDPYAAYYTAEEYMALMDTSAGKSEGIGINIINTTVEVSGVEYKVFRVINVMKNSPAAESGVKLGDMIWAVGVGENVESLNVLGYDVALKRLQGPAGTQAEFTVLRVKGEGFEQIPFSIARRSVTTTSVYSHKSTVDPKVGIVKIVQFDLTTPTQFSQAVDELLAAGCDRFVFDVRYNPGGDLASIEAVLSYFLSEGDVLIRIKTKDGEEETSRVKPVSYSGNYASCSVTKDDIGKYKDLKAAVLCNGSTASAAELFTATFRDYGLSPIVGETTFGKGSMQSIMPLDRYGYSGALKLTTAMYFSAKDEEGYDGVGIAPDHAVALSEAAKNKNVYEITDEEDDQLMKAISLLSN